jgi:hypothetical protein
MEDKIIMDFILNKRGEYLNDLVDILNKDLKSICIRISNVFKLHVKLNIKIKCPNCNKNIIVTPFDIINCENSFCSRECSNSYRKR